MSGDEAGPDRIRAAIERDRGMDAPQHPVNVCGPHCRGELHDDLEDYIAEQGPEFAAEVKRAERRIARRDRIAHLLICPGCLGFRLGFAHLSRKLFIGGCS
jgi:hypothetical protein